MKREYARARANRSNAKLSTGPRTRDGKARASRNSRKHGLCTAITSLPSWVARRDKLAQAITESYPTELSFELATEIAEAQADLERVQSVQEIFLEILAGKLEFRMPVEATQAPGGTRASPMSFDEAVQRLGKLARYEQRARSRRNQALRRASS